MSGKLIKIACGLAVVIVVVVLFRTLPLREWLATALAFVESLGPWAPIAYILLYTVAAVAFVPASLLTVAAGGIFGSFWGVICVILGATGGAAASFLVSRYVARKHVERVLGGSEHYRKLEKMTEQHGPFVVALTRMIPIFPFSPLNYLFGLTKVPFTTYIFWSFLCMLPGTMLYVVGADAVKTALVEKRIPWVLVAILAVVFCIVTGLVRYAKAQIKKKEAAHV